MTKIGYLLLICGFLAGAYATALDIDTVRWSSFIVAAIAAATGVLVVKRSQRGAARAEHVLSANRAELQASLDRVIRELESISAAGDRIGTGELRGEIDARLREDLRRFAEVRESMIHLFGVQTYADIMSEFAAGERQVNRVWSASTDGYRGEADLYLARATDRFRNARNRLEAAVNPG